MSVCFLTAPVINSTVRPETDGNNCSVDGGDLERARQSLLVAKQL